ncbi:MAG: hypothetical protein ACK57O_00125, partial [Planctomyces sp.]
ASNGRYEETASEAGVAVVAGFVRTAGWPQEKRWRWSWAGRLAKGMKDLSSQKSESRSLAGWGATTGWVMRWLTSFA